MDSFRSHLWQAAQCGRQYFDDETEAQGKVTCLGSEHSDILQHNAQSAAGRQKAHPGLPCTLSLPPVPCGAFFGQREPSSGPPDVAFMKAHFHHQRGLPCISLDPLLLSGQKPTPPLCSLWEAGKGDSELREGQQKHLRQGQGSPTLDTQLLPAPGLVGAGSHTKFPGPGPDLPAAQSTCLLQIPLTHWLHSLRGESEAGERLGFAYSESEAQDKSTFPRVAD